MKCFIFQDSASDYSDFECEPTSTKNRRGGASKGKAKPKKQTKQNPNKVVKFSEKPYEYVYCDECKVSSKLSISENILL